MKKLIVTCLLCLIPTFLFASEASFVWTQNPENNLAGYKIHYGNTSGVYSNKIDVGMGTVIDDKVYGSIINLTAGTKYYAVATAYDNDGIESAYSNEVVWITPLEFMLAIIKKNPDGTVDLLDTQGNVIAAGVVLP